MARPREGETGPKKLAEANLFRDFSKIQEFGFYCRINRKLLEHFKLGSDQIWIMLLKGTRI